MNKQKMLQSFMRRMVTRGLKCAGYVHTELFVGRDIDNIHSFFFYRTRKKLRKGNVFTPLSHSVHMGGLPQCMLGYTPPPTRPPWADTPRPKQTATAADGTHPTGMHSCFFFVFVLKIFVGHMSIFGVFVLSYVRCR